MATEIRGGSTHPRGVSGPGGGGYGVPVRMLLTGLVLALGCSGCLVSYSESYRAKKYEDVIRLGSEAVKADPKDVQAWYYLGLAQLGTQKLADAATSFRKVSESGTASTPFQIAAWLQLGFCELRQQRYREAAEALEKGITLMRPGTPPLQQVPADRADYAVSFRLSFLGDAYFGIGKYREAVARYDADLAENPGDSPSLADRALAYLALGEYDAALADVERYLAVPGEQRSKAQGYDAYASLTAAFAWAGKAEKAKAGEWLEKSKAASPERFDDELYAMASLAAGDFAGAQSVLRPRAYWGIEYKGAAGTSAGVELVSVLPSTPAERAGLRVGDVITTIEGHPVENDAKFGEMLRTMKPGTQSTLAVRRGRESLSLSIRVASLADFSEEQLCGRYEGNPRVAAALAKRKLYREAEAAERAGMPRQALEILVKGAADRGLEADMAKRIIVLARTVTPPPPIPEEARKRAVFAETALREAKRPQDFDRAVEEFRAAQKLAPWWADLYLNAGLVEEQAGRFAEAQRSFELFLFAVPDAPEAAGVRRKMYEMEFKARLQPAR